MARTKTNQDDGTKALSDNEYVCITKCFFNSVLWNPGDTTGYIPTIEESPYFEID